MKKLLFILFICLLVGCVTNQVISQSIGKQYVFLHQDSNSLKYVINDSVKNAYLKKTIVNSPIVSIDGVPFKYSQNRDTIHLPLKWADIRYLSFINKADSHILFGKKETNGAIIINTIYLK